jgi:aspartyl-tRNA(Asn)/glutamyl-tRNA(Gln) amidotransferase subunit C
VVKTKKLKTKKPKTRVIDKEQVKKIAELARLEIEDDKLDKFSKDLSSILGYVEELNSVDVSDVDPTLSAVVEKNVFREDGEPDPQDLEMTKKLLDLAPASEDGYIKVKAILK